MPAGYSPETGSSGADIERFQEKWKAVFRFGNATEQGHTAFFPMQSEENAGQHDRPFASTDFAQ
jgi:hypothetical protein